MVIKNNNNNKIITRNALSPVPLNVTTTKNNINRKRIANEQIPASH
jgi:hypothetical protein